MEIYNGTYCVYIHTNKTNGKRYVGQTIYGNNPNRRWGSDGGRYSSQQYFYRAIQKHGWDGFDHEVVASNLTKDEANNFEKILIKELNTHDANFGYNATDGGDGLPGYCHSEASIVKQKETMKKHYSNPAYIQKMRDVAPKRAICQFTLDGVFINEYESTMEAERITGISSGSISKCALEDRYCAGEYIFTFKENIETINERVQKYNNREVQRKERIVRLSLDGDYIDEWENSYTAGKQLGVQYKNINAVCRNVRKSAGGFRWMFLSDYKQYQKQTT